MGLVRLCKVCACMRLRVTCKCVPECKSAGPVVSDVCVHVCETYVCVCVCMLVCMHACVRECKGAKVECSVVSEVCTCVHACMCVCTGVHVCTIEVCVRACMHV